MRLSTVLPILLSLLCVGCFARGNLRGNQIDGYEFVDDANSYSNRRQLQSRQRLFTVVLNGLISILTPRISEKLLYIVGRYYSSYDFGWATDEQWLGRDAFLTKSEEVIGIQLPSICDPTAGNVTSDVTYEYTVLLAQVDGLGSLQIDKIEYVDGSQHIDLKVGFRTSADWMAQWKLETSFDNMTAHTMTTLTSTVRQASCGADHPGETAQSTVNGTVFFDNVVGRVAATVTGDTRRVARFVATSTINTMAVDEMAFWYDPIDTTTMGTFDLQDLDGDTSLAAEMIRNLDDLNATAPWGDSIEDEFHAYGVKMFTYTVEDELNTILPRPFIRPDDGI